MIPISLLIPFFFGCLPLIAHANLGQLLKPGTDLESAGPEVFKTLLTCTI